MDVIQPSLYGRDMTDVITRDSFGDVLRTWRARRHHSQLTLASEAGVSQRHISFLETGRSKPSREMVTHLGLVLDVPLRDRNAMLIAAGFAPVYAERNIDHPDLADVRRAIELMLSAHNPFPAYVIDRHWNLVLANDAAGSLMMALPEPAQLVATNLARLVLHPDGLRSVCRNWGAVAAVTLLRLDREVVDSPADLGLAELLDELRSYPGLPDDLSAVPSSHELLVPLEVEQDGRTLSFFTTIATLAAPADITLEELRLETLLPANTETEAALRNQ